jgi:hypothetical protein
VTGNIDLEKKAEQLTKAFATQITDQPMAYTQLLLALDFMIGPSQEIVIAGDPAHEITRAMIRAVRSKFLPNKVVLLHPDGPEGKRLEALSPFCEGMRPINQEPTVYVCEQYTCKTPIKELGQLESAIH